MGKGASESDRDGKDKQREERGKERSGQGAREISTLIRISFYSARGIEEGEMKEKK